MNKIINTTKEKVILKGHYKFTIRDAKTGKIKKVYEEDNIIPTVGRTLLANQLCNASPTNTPVINYIALGTGTTAVANGDTTLDTEAYRNSVASITNSNNVGYASGFFSATECNGTYKEAGIFSDGSAAADSGVLISRVLINSGTGIAKSNTETLTIDWSISIS